MTKVLKPYTIIPSNLYVNRSADKQIRLLVNDMGRPGYILVSRQMGKTNLLLNAKRLMEDKSTLFVYVDLSNHFDNVRDCFNNIIDVATDSHPDIFEPVLSIIEDGRKKESLQPAHKQHLSELRILLRIHTGKLIIVLDEIDALTKASYSDQIFAQIRSIYFTRINYPEFERLTYILSGVVEPSEIIKDPKISPFNIGQKIYLNDFTESEFGEFMEKTGLNLSNEIKERIYYWVNGNPRMTWDLSSEVENFVKENVGTSGAVDKIVEDFYLTTFDRPPIDNIREIISKDKELRKYMTSIIRGDHDSVPDHIKSKLYLSGIVNYDDKKVEIKNRIIAKSLSHSWLLSIETKSKSLLEQANAYYKNEEFLMALECFEKFFEENELPEDQASFSYFHMAQASFNEGYYEKAISYYLKCKFDKEDFFKYFLDVLYHLGMAYWKTGKYIESIIHLERYLKDVKHDSRRYYAASNSLGLAYLRARTIDGRSNAINLFKKLYEELEILNPIPESLGFDFVTNIKALLNFNIGEVHFQLEEKDLALLNYEQALINALDTSKPRIIYKIIKARGFDSKEEYEELVDFIINKSLKATNASPDKDFEFGADICDTILLECFLKDHNVQFDSLLNYASSNIYVKPLFDEIYYRLGAQSFQLGHLRESKKLLVKALDLNKSLNYEGCSDMRGQVLKFLVWVTEGDEMAFYFHEFHRFIKQMPTYTPDILSFEIFQKMIQFYAFENKYDQILPLVDFLNKFRDSVPDGIKSRYLIVDYYQLQILRMKGYKQESLSIANKILIFTDELLATDLKSNIVDATTVERIKEDASDYVNAETDMRIISNREFGRNDIIKVRYRSGFIVKDKYKRLENDIRTFQCVVIE